MIPIDKNKKKQAEEENSEMKQSAATGKEEVKTGAAEEVVEPETASEAAENETTASEEGKKENALPPEEEIAILNDKYLRICAEYDNYRRRTQKEKDNLYGDIKSNVVTSFLPVYDNLVRALAQPTEDAAYAKGVEMIMNQFNTTLEKLGVEEIKALGEKFDPALHNAVMHIDDEEKGENEIVEVFQKGFKCGDKIIRFAMVKVAN